MATSSPATASRSRPDHRQSFFLRDLASPLPSSAALRRQGPSDRDTTASPGTLPPPPLLTLSDRLEYTPDPLSPLPPSPSPTPLPAPRGSRLFASPSPLRSGGVTGAVEDVGWSPRLARSGGPGADEKGKGLSPSDGRGKEEALALITLPPPREVVRPEAPRGQDVFAPVAELDEEEWVTVYGFLPSDTNTVLREFEKCGEVVRHVPGPGDANWMHILYKSRYDARRALAKHGRQISSILMIGVKPLDPRQRAYLEEDPAESYGAAVDVLQSAGISSSSVRNAFAPVAGPHLTQNGGDAGRLVAGAIASPSKSVLSKVMELMFGI